MREPGEHLLVTDKRQDQEKKLGLGLFAFTLAGKFLNPMAVAVATLYWYQTPVPCSSLQAFQCGQKTSDSPGIL